MLIKTLFYHSGLPKAEVFGRSPSASLFGLQFWPPKFYSKYLAFGFVLKKSCSEAQKEIDLRYANPFLINQCENFDNNFFLSSMTQHLIGRRTTFLKISW